MLDRRYATGSEHKVIELKISVNTQDKVDHMQVIRFNLAARSEENEDTAENLWKKLDRHTAHLDKESMGDEVERQAECYQEMLSKVLDIIAMKITICALWNRWWNGDIKGRRSALGRERRRGRWSEVAAHAKAELHWSIRQSQSRMWNEYLLNFRGGEVCRPAAFAHPRVGATMEA